MRQALTDEEAIRRFLALSRWYLLEAHVNTAADGRISIEPPVAGPARGRVVLKERRAAPEFLDPPRGRAA